MTIQRMLSFVEGVALEGRVVVFTDGEMVFYGHRGDVIDGRFRIVRFGLESVDLVAIDGQGEQTLRLQPENLFSLTTKQLVNQDVTPVGLWNRKQHTVNSSSTH